MIKCTFENNNQASLRHATVHAVVVKGDKILMVKRAAHMENPNKYGFPGGFVDRDETLQQAALRELKEETGYEGKIIKLFSICDFPYRRGEDRQNIAFSFLVEAGDQTGQPDQESSAVVWLDLNQLPDSEAFAYDHLEHITLYKDYLHNESAFQLPIMMSTPNST